MSKAGRPTKYNEETCVKAYDYLNNFGSNGDVIPTIEGLALTLDIRRETVYDWIKHPEKTEFSNIVDEVLAKQSQILVNKGLTSDFNASITKLMLTKHGYSDKQEIDANLNHTTQEQWADELK